MPNHFAISHINNDTKSIPSINTFSIQAQKIPTTGRPNGKRTNFFWHIATVPS